MRSPSRKHSGRGRTIRAFSIVARLQRYSHAWLIALAFLFLLSSILAPNVWQKPRIGLADVFAPVISAVSQPFRFVADAIGGMTGITQLRADNDRLKMENNRLREWYQTALLLKAENQSLKDLLNVIPETEQSYISTKVIGDSGSSFVKSLLVQAGSQDNLKEGQAVMGSQGMIGRVIEVGQKASRILLMTDINSRVPVIIEGVNQKAILAGNNEDYLTLEHLPPDTLIEENARVVTSGLGGLFPQGLPIGKTFKKDDGEIGVRLFTDPTNASYVQIIEKPEDPNVRQSIELLTAPQVNESQ